MLRTHFLFYILYEIVMAVYKRRHLRVIEERYRQLFQDGPSSEDKIVYGKSDRPPSRRAPTRFP